MHSRIKSPLLAVDQKMSLTWYCFQYRFCTKCLKQLWPYKTYHFFPTLAHMQKSVGARARADRPDAAKNKKPPLPIPLGGWGVLSPLNPAAWGRGPLAAPLSKYNL